MADLAAEARRLTHLVVTCDLPRQEAAQLVERLREINELVSSHVPEEPQPLVWAPRNEQVLQSSRSMTDAMPFDVVVGIYNPIAPPVTVEIRPPKAYATARFGPAHGGAPGWVHGAVIAGVFDIVLTAANQLEDAAGPTARLEIRYRRPTLIDQEAHFEAWIERRHRNRVLSKGLLIQEGEVKVEAEGEFVTLDRNRLRPPWETRSGD
jgi:acyl-coenzyme A thioesterase PaaI-like protein